MSDSTNARCLGLVGGLGVGATIHYYQTLVAAHGRIGRVPALVMVHADVGRVLADIAADNLAGLADYLSAFLHQLARAGADLAALTGIAPHVCMPQLIEKAPLPLVDLVAELAGEVRRRGLTRVSPRLMAQPKNGTYRLLAWLRRERLRPARRILPKA